MSEEKNLEEIKKFWPKDAPDINSVPKYINKYKQELIVIKYGGNVLIDRNIFNNFIEDISILNKLGLSIVVVHGGGPRIERKLKKENIVTKFINGLRVTDEKVISIVENVLIDFNKDIVDSLKKKGSEAVTITSKTNNVINVVPDNKELGFVGIPDSINIEFKSFPLDMAALNASKLAHCNNDGKSDLLHFLYSNQKKWAKGSTIEELNSNLSSVIKSFDKPLDENKCFSNNELEAFILNERIEGVKEFDINATPTLILNNQKFEKTLSFKNLKKAIEKLL